MKRILFLLVVATLVFVWRDWMRREIVHPPGVLVPEAPQQSGLSGEQPFEFRGYRLTPRARFVLRARVLSRKDYRWGDAADLSPMDLALGWGAMSDQAVLERVEVSQGARWYYTRYEYPAPLPDRDIVRQSGNMHIIPADDLVRQRLGDIRRGAVVRAQGYLVDVDQESGFRWRTSPSRNDSGDGSCELFYVERIMIEPQNN